MPKDFAAARLTMVEQQLRARGIRSERVLNAMRRVPRELFVPPSLQPEAYDDGALPIDCEQTISQPVIVALMTEALELTGSEKVLEIGTGSGYQTAILTEVAAEVFSIERFAHLAAQAADRLSQLGRKNSHLKVADGAEGWPEEAPFDRILVTAAARDCPPALWEQLTEEGILVGPFGPPSEQSLLAMRKVGGQPQTRLITACRFVPLLGGTAP